MARKIFIDGDTARSSSGGLTILLIAVPLALVYFITKKRGGSTPASEPKKKTDTKETKKKEEKKKTKKRARIHHNTNSDAAPPVDPEWEALQVARPNNPFYQVQQPPENWGTDRPPSPVYKTSEEHRANLKGVHKPYKDGKIQQYDPRPGAQGGIKFIEGDQPYVIPISLGTDQQKAYLSTLQGV